jgi:hypothetical protein
LGIRVARESRRRENPARLSRPDRDAEGAPASPTRDARIAFGGVVFVSRLEMTAVFCFVGVTAISNCFGVPIRNRFGIEYWTPQICVASMSRDSTTVHCQ